MSDSLMTHQKCLEMQDEANPKLIDCDLKIGAEITES
jgi:hypothetical protein